MAGILLGAAATASPVVYSARGQLETLGADVLDLDGAMLVLVARADTTDAPVAALGGVGVERASYAVSLEATFTLRPGGAPDVTITYDSLLLTFNRFPPDGFPDAFFMASGDLVSFEGTLVSMPTFQADFADQSFFAGTDVASLPSRFAAQDVSVVARALNDDAFLPLYAVAPQGFTAVPEPGSAALVAVGLLALRSRRRPADAAGSQVVRPALTSRTRKGRPSATHASSDRPATAKAAR